MSLLDQLSPRQRQITAGALLLAIGVTAGVVVAPDDPRRDDRLVEIAARAGSATPPPGQPVDTAAYHEAMAAARAGRTNVTDLLTHEVPPGEFVDTEVNVDLGRRPQEVELIGVAVGRFSTTCGGCGLTFADSPASTDAGVGFTTIRLRAQNTSSETLRLTALVRHE